MLRWWWCALCLWGCLSGATRAEASDTAYVAAYGERFTIRPFLEKQFHALRYHSQAAQREKILLANTPIGVGLGVSWRQFGISLSVGIPGTQHRRDAPTQAFDFQYHYHGRHLVGDLYIQWYKGYYRQQADGTLEFDTRLSFRRLGLRLAYPLLGDRVSYAALFNQSAAQRRVAFCYPVGVGLYWQDTHRMASGERPLRGGQYVGEVYAGMCAALPLGRGFYTALEITLGLSGHFARFTPRFVPLHLAAMGRTVIGYSTRQWSLALVAYAHSLGATSPKLHELHVLSGSSELAFSWRLLPAQH